MDLAITQPSGDVSVFLLDSSDVAIEPFVVVDLKIHDLEGTEEIGTVDKKRDSIHLNPAPVR
jgi:hypothetical protein